MTRRKKQDTDAPAAQASSISSGYWIALVCIAIIVAAFGGYLASQNKGFKIAFEKGGSLAIDVSADESFGQLLAKALKNNRSEVDAILVGQGYYNLSNASFVDQLAHLNNDTPEAKEVAQRLRRLLWDLRGPFELPYTMSGADEEMVKAINVLEAERESNKKVNGFLVGLWKASLNGDGIFWPRSFTASIEVIRGAATESILACPRDEIATGGVVVNLSVDNEHWITRKLEKNPALFRCGGSQITAEKLLAESGPLRLGVSEETYRKLVPVTTGTREGRISATFQFYPEYMTGIQIQ